MIRPICGDYLDEQTRYYINETGKFVVGGPQGDTGVTGRTCSDFRGNLQVGPEGTSSRVEANRQT